MSSLAVKSTVHKIDIGSKLEQKRGEIFNIEGALQKEAPAIKRFNLQGFLMLHRMARENPAATALMWDVPRPLIDEFAGRSEADVADLASSSMMQFRPHDLLLGEGRLPNKQALVRKSLANLHTLVAAHLFKGRE